MENKLEVYPVMMPSKDNGAPLWKGFNYDYFTNNVMNDDIETFYHLYLISNDPLNRPIKANDWVLISKDVIRQVVLDSSILEVSRQCYPKIEASTNSCLGLPLIPDSFIWEWVEKQGNIESVYIEMQRVDIRKNSNDMPEFITKPFVQNREVIIIPTKDSFSRNDVKKIVNCYITGYSENTPPFDEWLDKNY